MYINVFISIKFINEKFTTLYRILKRANDRKEIQIHQRNVSECLETKSKHGLPTPGIRVLLLMSASQMDSRESAH